MLNKINQTKKSQTKILIAFLLNLGFSIYELIGGILTGSTAIASDAVHDFGDAISIGISYFLERKSTRRPDANYTYGYARYSLIGGVITTIVLLAGSLIVIANAIVHLFNPVAVNYDGMIILAVIGVVINLLAAYITHGSSSLNQKSVNLHMLEDVLGWIVVLAGAIVMRFTHFAWIDPILSIAVAIFVLVHAWHNFNDIIDVFLEKTPHGISVDEIAQQLREIEDVTDVHHFHVWSLDGYRNYATLHVVSRKSDAELKQRIKSELTNHGITHSTIEFEKPQENCPEHDCKMSSEVPAVHAHEH